MGSLLGSILDTIRAWLRIARLHFYPPVAVLYVTGALAARRGAAGLDGIGAALGYAYLFLVGVAASMSNDYVDHASDAANVHAGPFTGGSRVLVEGRLGFGAVRAAIVLVVAAALTVAGAVTLRAPAELRGAIAALVVLGLLLGLGYALPPLRLSYRGLGELDVAFMHSAFAVLFGYVVQGADWRDALPHALGLPSFFAVLSAITLAGLPDHAADAGAGKRSWSVLLGRRAAAIVALGAALAAAAGGLWLWLAGIVAGPVGALFVPAAVHALALAAALVRYVRSGAPAGRIDALLVNALLFTLWFGAIPLACYLAGAN